MGPISQLDAVIAGETMGSPGVGVGPDVELDVGLGAGFVVFVFGAEGAVVVGEPAPCPLPPPPPHPLIVTSTIVAQATNLRCRAFNVRSVLTRVAVDRTG
jgi:hypothetical protein